MIKFGNWLACKINENIFKFVGLYSGANVRAILNDDENLLEYFMNFSFVKDVNYTEFSNLTFLIYGKYCDQSTFNELRNIISSHDRRLGVSPKVREIILKNRLHLEPSFIRFLKKLNTDSYASVDRESDDRGDVTFSDSKMIIRLNRMINLERIEEKEFAAVALTFEGNAISSLDFIKEFVEKPISLYDFVKNHFDKEEMQVDENATLQMILKELRELRQEMKEMRETIDSKIQSDKVLREFENAANAEFEDIEDVLAQVDSFRDRD